MGLQVKETDGWLKIDVEQAGGAVTQVTLDLYEATNVYAGIFDEHYDAAQRGAAWVEWLATKGVTVSQADASRVIEAVWEGVAEFKKKHGLEAPSPTPALSDSSASPLPV